MNRSGSESAGNPSAEMDQIRQEMKQLREDIKGLGGALSRLVDSAKESGQARAYEEFEKLQDELRDTYGTVHAQGKRARASLEREIEERPFTSVAGAFVIGMVLGKLFSSVR